MKMSSISTISKMQNIQNEREPGAPGVRWQGIPWKEMPPPEDRWVMLKHEGADGDELLTPGFIHHGTAYESTCYDGDKVTFSEPCSLTLFDGWAPILTSSPGMTWEQYLLHKIAEESAEICQAAHKAMGFGLGDTDPTKPSLGNRQILINELTDLFGVVALAVRFNLLPSDWLSVEGVRRKAGKVVKWASRSKEHGMLEEVPVVIDEPSKPTSLRCAAFGINPNGEHDILFLRFLPHPDHSIESAHLDDDAADFYREAAMTAARCQGWETNIAFVENDPGFAVEQICVWESIPERNVSFVKLGE